jgi:hypothetical protein
MRKRTTPLKTTVTAKPIGIHCAESEKYPPFKWIVLDDVGGNVLAAFFDAYASADYAIYLRSQINKEKQ